MKRTHYMLMLFQHNSEIDGVAPEMSIVAVKNGKAVACILRGQDAPGGLPQLFIPDYVTFVSLFDGEHEFINHPPVKEGTPWNGTEFILPDLEGFEAVGEIS
jgi:hypothetical protein